MLIVACAAPMLHCCQPHWTGQNGNKGSRQIGQLLQRLLIAPDPVSVPLPQLWTPCSGAWITSSARIPSPTASWQVSARIRSLLQFEATA